MIQQHELQSFREKVNDLKAEKRILTQQLNEKKVEKQEAEIFGIDALEARTIIQSVAEKTQQNMVKYFTSLITPLIQAVWEDDRQFCMEFIQKRNVTECDVWVEKDGNRASIFGSSGGGLSNIIAIGCRLAFWFLEKKTRAIFFLDEPFSALNSAEYQQRISTTIKELSEKLKAQFIIVSDQEYLEADRMFRVENGNVRIV